MIDWLNNRGLMMGRGGGVKNQVVLDGMGVNLTKRRHLYNRHQTS